MIHEPIVFEEHTVTRVGGPHREGPYPRDATRIRIVCGAIRAIEAVVVDIDPARARATAERIREDMRRNPTSLRWSWS